jgi:hypothetical protein
MAGAFEAEDSTKGRLTNTVVNVVCDSSDGIHDD